MPSSTADGLLIYDGDCGFCTATAGWIERRLPDGAQVSPWQALNISQFDLTEDDVSTAAYWVDPAGRVYRGEEGIAQSLLAAGGVWGLVGRLMTKPPFRQLASVSYPIIARNRHRLPGSTNSCRLSG